MAGLPASVCDVMDAYNAFALNFGSLVGFHGLDTPSLAGRVAVIAMIAFGVALVTQKGALPLSLLAAVLGIVSSGMIFASFTRDGLDSLSFLFNVVGGLTTEYGCIFVLGMQLLTSLVMVLLIHRVEIFRKIAVGAVSTALLVYLIYGALTNAMVTFGDLLSPLSGVAGVSMVINFFQQTAESKADDIVTASALGGAVVGAGLLGASNFDNALAMLGNGLLAEALVMFLMTGVPEVGVGGVLPQAADLFLVYVLGIFVALSIARNVLYNPPAKAPTRKPPAKKGSTPPSRGKKSMV